MLRYGEIFLKGKNRTLFENKLISNVKKITGIKKVKKIRGRLIIDYFLQHNSLKNVFGLVSYSPAVRVEKDVDEIKRAALSLLSGTKGTFRVDTKRSDKSFPVKSPEFNAVMGKYIEVESDLRFSFGNPDVMLTIEINQDGAYLFTETNSCFGGLPTGVEGNAILLVEDESSILAGLLFMKRGCSVIPVSLHGQKDVSLLQKFSPFRLTLNVFKDFCEVDGFAKVNKVDIVISGQTFDDVCKCDTGLTLFRPLIAYGKKGVEQELASFSD